MKDVKGKEEQTDEVCDKCGKPMVIKWGRYGKFLACSGYPECKNTRQLAGRRATAARAARGRGQGGLPVDRRTPMVLKKGRFGPFLACSNYPECKVTKRLVRGAEGGSCRSRRSQPIDENCPECGKPLMWRRGRFGPFIACSDYPELQVHQEEGSQGDRPRSAPSAARARWSSARAAGAASFYGCKRYPECKFTAYHRPIPEPCPDCGRAYLLEKETKKEGKVIFCGNEACHYKRDAA